MLDQALAVEGAEVGLGVAYVDREEHGGDYPPDSASDAVASVGSPGALYSSPPPTRHVGAADARAQGNPYKRTDLIPVVSKAVLKRLGFPGSPCRP